MPVLTGGAPGSLKISENQVYSSVVADIASAATGSLLAAAYRGISADGSMAATRVGSIPIKLKGLKIANRTAGALTVVLTLVPYTAVATAANGTGAIPITGALAVAANVIISPLANEDLYIPLGYELLAVASATGLTAITSWDQER